mgnify:CR=1 FL=1
MEINLLSDTITKPTKGMLEAMFRAEVGDDVFKADPTVNQLQKKVAALFGKEDALFFPSGTMANQTAIKLHTQPGDKLFCDKWAHVYQYEGGGAAFNSGVTCKLIYIVLKAISGEYKPGTELFILAVGLLLFFTGLYLRGVEQNLINPIYLIVLGITLKVIFIIKFIQIIRSSKK